MRIFFNGDWAWIGCNKRSWKARTVRKTKPFAFQTRLLITASSRAGSSDRSASVQLSPFFELCKPQAGQRVHIRPAGFFMPPRQAIVFVNELRQPFGDGEAFVFTVGNRL